MSNHKCPHCGYVVYVEIVAIPDVSGKHHPSNAKFVWCENCGAFGKSVDGSDTLAMVSPMIHTYPSVKRMVMKNMKEEK